MQTGFEKYRLLYFPTVEMSNWLPVAHPNHFSQKQQIFTSNSCERYKIKMVQSYEYLKIYLERLFSCFFVEIK